MPEPRSSGSPAQCNGDNGWPLAFRNIVLVKGHQPEKQDAILATSVLA
jgi:hypothetical protein